MLLVFNESWAAAFPLSSTSSMKIFAVREGSFRRLFRRVSLLRSLP